jgi:tungstate transport system substrate-binding protein
VSVLFALFCVSPGLAGEDRALRASPEASHGPVLIVGNETGETTVFSPKQFAELPRTTIQAKPAHSDQTATYEGVLFRELLKQAGVEVGGEPKPGKKPRRSSGAACVLVEASDGYQVVFAIQELFDDTPGHEVILADRRDGQPLDAKTGPYQVIVAGVRSHGRWVRQVTRILARPVSASPFGPPSQAPREPAPTPAVAPGVYLVGTGPGDPELISRKAADVLQSADLVFCYSWMKDELAPFVRPGVVEVASSQLRGGRSFRPRPGETSEEARERVARARQALAELKARIKKLVGEGKVVAFADNGDPSLFSPWGWLPEQLAELDLVVVPGISSFNAGNAALRQNVSCGGTVIISSGGELGTPDENGRLAGVIVFFTHRTKLDQLLPQLESRYPADTPVAIVCDVSYPNEKVVRGTLGSILDVLAGEKLPHLYLFYVGDGLAEGPVKATEFDAAYGSGTHAITVATGSPGELGLLEALAEAFSDEHDTAVRWKKAGSGKSLALLKQKRADVALVHAPEAEKQAVAEGWAMRRTPIGSNEFLIVGPKDDPAGVAEATSAADAFARIARAKATFLSRGDNSGTHKRETAIWEQAGIAPSGDWYVVTNDFMMATLRRVNRESGYFMTDSSTWVAARADLDNLKALFRGDPALVNVYHGLCVPEDATEGQAQAAAFLDFLASEEAQAIVGNYGKDCYGEPLYSHAEYAKAFDH